MDDFLRVRRARYTFRGAGFRQILPSRQSHPYGKVSGSPDGKSCGRGELSDQGLRPAHDWENGEVRR